MFLLCDPPWMGAHLGDAPAYSWVGPESLGFTRPCFETGSAGQLWAIISENSASRVVMIPIP